VERESMWLSDSQLCDEALQVDTNCIPALARKGKLLVSMGKSQVRSSCLNVNCYAGFGRAVFVPSLGTVQRLQGYLSPSRFCCNYLTNGS
jgi:hypothetical protein